MSRLLIDLFSIFRAIMDGYKLMTSKWTYIINILIVVTSITSTTRIAYCAERGSNQNHNFRFVSCQITESSFYVINLLGAKHGKSYQMILDGDVYDKLCPQLKKDDLINITYRQERIQDEGDGDFFDAYILLSYKIVSDPQSNKVRNKQEKEQNDIYNIFFYVFIVWIIWAIVDKFLISFKSSNLELELGKELQLIYLNHGVASDFAQNNLTDQFLTDVMYNIKSKRDFKILLNAVKSNHNFFTSDVFKEAFLKKLKAYGKQNKIG